MEGFYVLDSENCGLGGKMNGERLSKKPSLGGVVRKRLSDITNSQQQPKSPIQDEKPRPISFTTKDYIEQLHKENAVLVRLLAERNKIIELTGAELGKIRINLQKEQQRNWQLAQAHTQILAELNVGKDRLKVMHHELGCKVALLSAKNLELQEKMKKTPCQKTATEERTEKCEEEIKGEALQGHVDIKTCKPNRRRQSRSQSLGGSSSVTEQVAMKEKTSNKSHCVPRHFSKVKSEQPEPTDEKADNKRLCLRRQSARFKSEQPKPTEDLFEIEEATFPIRQLLDEPMTTTKEWREGKSTLRCETPELRRSSIARPTRRAAEKVESYKELPLNVKMRRGD